MPCLPSSAACPARAGKSRPPLSPPAVVRRPQAGMQPTPGGSGRGVLGTLAWRTRPGGTMEPIPEDWERAVAVVAHPDDLEYGAASAVARWTGQGRTVSYLIVTR